MSELSIIQKLYGIVYLLVFSATLSAGFLAISLSKRISADRKRNEQEWLDEYKRHILRIFKNSPPQQDRIIRTLKSDRLVGLAFAPLFGVLVSIMFVVMSQKVSLSTLLTMTPLAVFSLASSILGLVDSRPARLLDIARRSAVDIRESYVQPELDRLTKPTDTNGLLALGVAYAVFASAVFAVTWLASIDAPSWRPIAVGVLTGLIACVSTRSAKLVPYLKILNGVIPRSAESSALKAAGHIYLYSLLSIPIASLLLHRLSGKPWVLMIANGTAAFGLGIAMFLIWQAIINKRELLSSSG